MFQDSIFTHHPTYGMYLRAPLTALGDLIWRQQCNGSWGSEKTILDSSNYSRLISQMRYLSDSSCSEDILHDERDKISNMTGAIKYQSGSIDSNFSTDGYNVFTPLISKDPNSKRALMIYPNGGGWGNDIIDDSQPLKYSILSSTGGETSCGIIATKDTIYDYIDYEFYHMSTSSYGYGGGNLPKSVSYYARTYVFDICYGIEYIGGGGSEFTTISFPSRFMDAKPFVLISPYRALEYTSSENGGYMTVAKVTQSNFTISRPNIYQYGSIDIEKTIAVFWVAFTKNINRH